MFGLLFIANKAHTSLYKFMREVGSCDESYQGEGDLSGGGGGGESFY